MHGNLSERLRAVRSRIRAMLWLYGLSWLIAVVPGSILIVGTLDWLFHLDDSGVRLILGLGIVAAGGFVMWRSLIAPLRRSLSDVELAMRIEERYPHLRDSLASTVQFMESGTDPRLGSPEMQQRVIRETLKSMERVDPSDIIETGPLQQIAAAAVGVCLMVAMVVGFNQTAAATALGRLVFPFSQRDWPRETELVLLNAEFLPIEHDEEDPLRVARGETLTLYVEDRRGKLPETVELQMRIADEEVTTRTLRQTTLRDESGAPRDVAVATFAVTRGPLEFRATGGDDLHMPWYQVHVVPPPIVEEFQVTLTPPAYTGRPQEKLPPGVGHIQGLIGTQVRVLATANKPLQTASLRIKDGPAVDIPLKGDQRRLTATFTIEQSGVYSYWFELRDQQSFENPDAPRYEIRGVADREPDVFIELPATDQNVTPDAVVPLKVVAKDDLALREVRVPWKTEDTPEPTSDVISLLAPPADPGKTAKNDDALPAITAHTAEHQWELAELALTPGARITFHAEATDAFDLDGGHVGRSITRTLTIIGPEAKAAELAAQQNGILEELERVLKTQTRAREQLGELQTQLRTVGQLRPEDIDLLKRIELEQRQVSSRLLNPVDGVESRATGLQEEIRNNRITAPDMEQRLRGMTDELSLLKTDVLPMIRRELTRARKGVQMERFNDGASRQDRSTEDSQSEDGTDSPPRDSDANTQSGTGAGQKRSDGTDGNEKTSPRSDREKSDSSASESSQKDATGKQSEQQVAAATSTREQVESLTQARRGQEAVLDSLEQMLQELARWRDQRDLETDLSEVIEGQKQLNRDAAEMQRPSLLGKSPGDLTSQERADLAKLADRQRQSAEKLEKLHRKLGDAAERLSETNRTAAGSLQDAADQLQSGALAGRMRSAAERLQENRVGAAAQQQQGFVDELQELQDVLRNRSSSDTEALVKKLKQAETELETLRKRQEDLLQKLQKQQDAPASPQRDAELQRLRKESQQLRENVERLSRQLRRLRAERSSASLRRAAERMPGERGNPDGSAPNDDPQQLQEQQQEALDDLEQAQRELARERQSAEEQLAREMLEKIADELAGMIARQQNVIDETRRLEAARLERGNWSRSHLKSLRNLAEVQQGLSRETDRLAETLTAAEVFALALRGASRSMQRAAALLDDKQAGEVTIANETSARRRFEDLVEALKSANEQNDQDDPMPPQNGDQPPEQQQSGPETDGIPHLAQIRMLKSLQEDLLRRSRELHARSDSGKSLTKADQAELQDLAREQGQLADLARNLTEQVMQAMGVADDEEQQPPGESPDGAEKQDEPDDDDDAFPESARPLKLDTPRESR